jgi:predicted DNA-binding transcriptional regulator YafY
LVEQEDGGLVVTFEASGLVETAWHLYKWGDAVEVFEPAGLRDLVAGFQNSGIRVLP